MGYVKSDGGDSIVLGNVSIIRVHASLRYVTAQNNVVKSNVCFVKPSTATRTSGMKLFNFTVLIFRFLLAERNNEDR
jgi:hypothetical protein